MRCLQPSVLRSRSTAHWVCTTNLQREDRDGTRRPSPAHSPASINTILLNMKSKNNKKPTTAILVVDDGDELKTTPALKFRYDRMFPLVDYKMIRDELVRRNKKKMFFADILIAHQLNRSNLMLRKKKFTKRDSITREGSMLIWKQKKTFNYTYKSEPYIYSKQGELLWKLKAFNGFVKLCKKNNIELIKNYSKWFGLKYELVFFYNVYGPNQIMNGPMSAIIGIFESQYKKRKPLTIVKPGSQRRDFTHVDDIVRGCYLAWVKGKQKEYMLCTSKTYSILEIAKMFGSKFKFLKSRPGDRFGSVVSNNNAKKILGFTAKKDIKNYIKDFISKN